MKTKLTLHKIVLYMLIKLFPKLFERYYKEYKEMAKKYRCEYCGQAATTFYCNYCKGSGYYVS